MTDELAAEDFDARQAEAEQKAALVKLAYARLFAGTGRDGDAELVVADLRAFCGALTDLFDPESDRRTAFALGRFRVWQRIERMRDGAPDHPEEPPHG